MYMIDQSSTTILSCKKRGKGCPLMSDYVAPPDLEKDSPAKRCDEVSVHSPLPRVFIRQIPKSPTCKGTKESVSITSTHHCCMPIPLNHGQDRMKVLTSGKTVSRLRSASKRRQIEKAATCVYPLGPSIKEEAVARASKLLT